MNDSVPLAEKLRPKTLSEFIGQPHLVSRKGIITKLITAEKIPSLIFWGPPGSGKTTLAYLINKKLNTNFIAQSAVTAKLEDVRQIISQAQAIQKLYQKQTILFIDEIHRFNKAQQDAFLPFVEKGIITLIGATTENPSFEVIGPLLSRCRVLVLYQLKQQDLILIANKALKYLGRNINSEALKFLINSVNGDARILITTLEIAINISAQKQFNLKIIEQALQNRQLLYDRQGDEHYNTISAFIKSMRASQPDAALYYLARMIEAGEDPLFIARRMVIFASEDIGMAQPTALVVANEIFKACDTIGYPECAINLAHGTVYLALAKKDRSAYNGLKTAQDDIKKYGNLPIPLNILNAPTKLMRNLGYGQSYQKYSSHSYLPDKLKHRQYYTKK